MQSSHEKLNADSGAQGPIVSDSVNLIWGHGICILIKTPGDYDAGGSWPYFEKQYFNSSKYLERFDSSLAILAVPNFLLLSM